MFVDGDWVKAKGTALGANNVIGVVAIMTLLVPDESTDELCVEIPDFLLEP